MTAHQTLVLHMTQQRVMPLGFEWGFDDDAQVSQRKIVMRFGPVLYEHTVGPDTDCGTILRKRHKQEKAPR